MRSSLKIIAFFFVLSLSCLPAFSSLHAEEKSPEGPEKVVAKVNDASITMKMVAQAVEERIPATGHRSLSEQRQAEIWREELDKLIIRELIHQEGKRLGTKVASKEVDEEFSKIKGRFASESEFKEALKRQNLTMEEVREGLKRHLMIQKVIEKEVYSRIALSDAELKEYYDGHKDQFKIPDQVRLRILLVRVDPSGLAADWEEGRKKAQGLAKRAKKGEDFAKLTVQFSEDPETKENGGDMGFIHKGMLPYAEIEDPAFSLPVGKVSDPIRVLPGYVVLKVEQRQPSKQLSFDEVNKELLRSEMRSSAAKRRLDEWIQGLKAKADIKIYK